MRVELVIAPEVANDLTAAYVWYEDRRLGLGEDFLSCIDAGITMICRFPEMYPIAFENYRRGLVRRFPYAIFYEHSNSIVTVYAVLHTSSNPEKWRSRLK